MNGFQKCIKCIKLLNCENLETSNAKCERETGYDDTDKQTTMDLQPQWIEHERPMSLEFV